MRCRVLGRTGLQVSVIGFGGIPIQRVPASEAGSLIHRALDLGINFFDTARGYTDSEAKLGSVLRQRRNEAIIATKSMARTAGDMASDIRASLKAMGVDYIDLYQLHNIKNKAALERVLSPGGALTALQQAREAGLIRHIGITGHIKDFLLEALQIPEIETVQFPFNPVESNGVRELLELSVQTETGVIIMKPLAGGAFSNANLALRFVLEHHVSTVIPGMDSLQQLEDNVKAGLHLLPLSAQERKVLEEETGQLGAAFCRRCEYCRPCRQGIDIPSVFLLDGYYRRYNLQEWARERYRGLKTTADQCIGCGECEERCPYHLPIREMLVEASGRLA
ncbi:MAG: aldo/keto reductase [Desulfotomaculaceae bacterium]|nr:aldo/keto reductase [Desulfotomaculaceae bacterium]